MRARFRNFYSNPKRYAISSGILWATWMTISMIVRDAISHRTITLASIIGTVVLWASGSLWYGWFVYRQRIRRMDDGGMSELIHRYEAEQAATERRRSSHGRKRSQGMKNHHTLDA